MYHLRFCFILKEVLRFFTANLQKKGPLEFCPVPFTTYNNTRNLRFSQSAVFCSVPKSADCGVLLYLETPITLEIGEKKRAFVFTNDKKKNQFATRLAS